MIRAAITGDLNPRMACNMPYRDWYATFGAETMDELLRPAHAAAFHRDQLNLSNYRQAALPRRTTTLGGRVSDQVMASARAR